MEVNFMSESSEKQAVLELFNLDRDRVEDISYYNLNGDTVIEVLLRPDYPPCPDCGWKNPQIKEYILKKINYGALTDRKCTLFYTARRYICPVCHRTYYETNPFCFKKQKISVMTAQNVLRDLKNATETFSTVAERYHISPNSAASIFDQHVMEPRRELPELMCWDENYAFYHKGENSKYIFVMLDFQTIEPVDILPSRRMDYLKSYFLKIPQAERSKVKMISTDMYSEYRSIIRSLFPKAIHTVDHYHVSQEMSRKLDKVRNRVMKSVPKFVKGTKIQTDEYYLLKKFNWLIFKRPDAQMNKKDLFDPDAEKVMNRKLGRLLNYYDIKNMIKAVDPELEKGWELKDSLVNFYDESDHETARENLQKLIRKFSSSGVKEMQEFANTLRGWQDEIVNSFIVVDTRHEVDKGTGHVVVSAVKLNNGLMENRNSVIKTIKKAANGYTNWERFRNRCLYVLRSGSVPRLNPVIPVKNEIQRKENG